MEGKVCTETDLVTTEIGEQDLAQGGRTPTSTTDGVSYRPKL